MITLQDLNRDWNEFQCSALMMEYETEKFNPNKLREIQNKLNEKIKLYIDESIELESDKNDLRLQQTNTRY